ncbi:protein kinase domain-containing protein [Streptomyces sp. NPDC002144]
MNQSPGDESRARLLAGRYRLVEQLGHGGMGTVWRAHDELLDREVAVKEVRVGSLSPEERSVLRARLQQEARAAARIRHPNVVTVFDVLQEDDGPWIVMEWIDGRSLEDILVGEGTLLPREAARFGAAVLAALDSAHQLGILHRDVKPANVLLERSGRIVLTDFGIALLDGSPGLTRTGDIVGSPDYLAPERATGHRPGPPSDLWSLGATLYAAVEGQSPFRRSTTLSTLQAVIADPLPEPHHAGPLAPVIEALLRKDPEERPTASEARRMLEEVAAGGTAPSAAHPPTEVVPSEGMPPEGMRSPGEAVPDRSATPTAPLVTDVPAEHRRIGTGRRTRLMLVIAAALAMALVGGLVWALTAKPGATPTAHPTASTVTATSSPRTVTTQPATHAQPTAQSPTAPSTPTSTSTSESSSPTPVTSTAPPPAASGPETTVTAYFDAINAGDFQRAWELGGRNLQQGSYESFRNSFAGTADESVTVTSVDGDSVGVELDATQTDGTHRYFSGTYTVRDGAIVAADIHAED